MDHNLAQLPLDFRKEESGRLFRWIAAGESVSVYGVSGIGKSNLFNHLLNESVQRHYLGEDCSKYFFLRANFHYLPDFEGRSVYSQILESLELQDPVVARLKPGELDEIRGQHEKLLASGNDDLKILRHFKLALYPLLAANSRRLVILLDQFDDVYREASPRVLVTLRGLREAFKYSISFLAFTREALTDTADADQAKGEFYELFASNMLPLTPYTEAEAHLVVERILKRNQATVNRESVELLVRLTGGHAGLLRATCMILINEEVPFTPIITPQVLLRERAIDTECEKIWISLSVEERKALSNCLRNIGFETDPLARDKLLKKGVLAPQEHGKWSSFSPLFTAYVQKQDAPWEQELYWDRASRRVWVLGQATELLTAQESRLFQILFSHPNEVITKEELIEAGWPDAHGGVTDEALGVAIFRLRRKIEPNSEQFRYIENVREHGYRLCLK